MSEPGPTATPSTVKLVPITYSRLLEELGRLSIMFNMMESVVCHRTWLLIGPEQRIGRAVTAKMAFAQVADLLRDLYILRHPEPENQERMKALHAAMRATNDRRNNLLHTSWGTIKADPPMVGRTKTRFTGQGSLTRVELKEAIGDVMAAINEIALVTNQVFGLLPDIVVIGDGT